MCESNKFHMFMFLDLYFNNVLTDLTSEVLNNTLLNLFMHDTFIFTKHPLK